MEIDSMMDALQDTPEGWIKFLAIRKAKIVLNPLTEMGYAIRRSPQTPKLDRHLLGRKMRDYVIGKLLDAYGDIETINRLIKENTP